MAVEVPKASRGITTERLTQSYGRVYDERHMAIARSKKEETRERILRAAARAIRKHGFEGVGVAEVMKEAGLTHGGFYAHFESRDALLAAAADQAGGETLEILTRAIAAAKPGQE